ncbi:hypothetical protein VNO78_17257 [Psophocarpus tetragonolobus]|uniref:Uncharacterized protein n=1 Tax=Psophocarpus tetragonolobus TaxID=3891 RepID=A0AAN9SIV3_PSOTE
MFCYVVGYVIYKSRIGIRLCIVLSFQKAQQASREMVLVSLLKNQEGGTMKVYGILAVRSVLIVGFRCIRLSMKQL